MTNSMFEKAAIGIWNTRTGSNATPWEKLLDVHREAFIADVRAVLTAIREPNEEMIEAAQTATSDWLSENDMDLAWKAMIDSILKEGTP